MEIDIFLPSNVFDSQFDKLLDHDFETECLADYDVVADLEFDFQVQIPDYRLIEIQAISMLIGIKWRYQIFEANKDSQLVFQIPTILTRGLWILWGKFGLENLY